VQPVRFVEFHPSRSVLQPSRSKEAITHCCSDPLPCASASPAKQVRFQHFSPRGGHLLTVGPKQGLHPPLTLYGSLGRLPLFPILVFRPLRLVSCSVDPMTWLHVACNRFVDAMSRIHSEWIIYQPGNHLKLSTRARCTGRTSQFEAVLSYSCARIRAKASQATIPPRSWISGQRLRFASSHRLSSLNNSRKPRWLLWLEARHRTPPRRAAAALSDDTRAMLNSELTTHCAASAFLRRMIQPKEIS